MVPEEPKAIPAKKEKSSVWKPKPKAPKAPAGKPVQVPDGIEISWRKPPPPSEVAEAMKFLKPKTAPKAVEDSAEKPEGPALVSCPFCRGQFADVSEHMDHCPVITGSGTA
jgi:hypothetical protein